MASRIRVITVIDLIGRIGGAEHIAMLLASHLDRDRFEPVVCVTRFGGDHPLQGAMEDAVAELRGDGVKVLGLGRSGTLDLLPWRRLVAELRAGVHVLHAHTHGSNFWGSVIGTAAGTPVIIAHEHTWSFEGEPLRRLVDRHVIGRLADAVIAVSREDRRRMTEIEGIPAHKIRYIPNGAPERAPAGGRDVRAELGIPPGAPVLGSVGMLRAQKAFEVLVDAAALLRDRHPDLRVLIAGRGEEREALERRIAERGLRETVLLLGHRTDVPDVIRAFDVAVTCSDYEGMPVSVLEYLDAALPVVATRVGALPDLVEDGVHGLLVAPRDPAALAEAAEALLTDPARRRAMGERGRARRRAEFGLDAMVRRVEDLYVELLERRTATM